MNIAPDWSLVHFDVECARCGHDLRGQIEPTCPACQLEFAWADAVPLERLTCLHCGYHLYGLCDSRCPECGERFDWKEVLSNFRRRQKDLFEYRWREQPLRSFFRTWFRALRPWKFWRNVEIHDPVQPAPIAAFLLGVFLILVVAEAIVNAAVYCIRWQVLNVQYLNSGYPIRPLTWAEAIGQFGWRFSIALQSWGAAATLWASAFLAALFIFQQSMGRCRVRGKHVLRAWAFSVGVWLFAFAPVDIFRVVLTEYFEIWWVDFGWVGWVAIVVCSTISIAMAYKHYLRMPHGVGIAISAQVIALLVTLIATCLYSSGFLSAVVYPIVRRYRL